MRHLTAAQREDGTGWHYVSMNRRGGHPLGDCANHAPHATEAEARECYGEYLRSQVYLDERGRWSWGGCDVKGCPNPSQRAARCRADAYVMAMLCDEHWTVEDAIKAMDLDGPAGDSWQS